MAGHHNHPSGSGGGGNKVTDGGLFAGDTGEYGAQTDPNAYYNYLLSQQGITPDSVPSDVWNYTQNQMFNNWYSGYKDALGANKKLTLQQYAGQAPASEAPNQRQHPNQYQHWLDNGGANQAGIGAGLQHPIDVGAIQQNFFRDQAEADPQTFYNAQAQRAGELGPGASGAALGYDQFITKNRFQDRYNDYVNARQQQGILGAPGTPAPTPPPAPGSFGAPQNNGVVTTPGGVENPAAPNRHQHPNQYHRYLQQQNAGGAGAPTIAPPIATPGGTPNGAASSWYGNQMALDPATRLQQDNAAFNVLTPAQRSHMFGIQNPFDRSRIVNWA